MLRFATLDAQSFWLDELVTVSLLDRGLGDALAEVPRSEATPYAYYVVAWLWGQAFGLGEVGLRSLSALAGTATIPVAYGAGAALVSRRAGLVAAALVAANPFLVWYSQEARSYALFALVGAATVLAFGHALRGSGGWLAAWAAPRRARDRDALLRRLPRRGGGALAAPAAPRRTAVLLACLGAGGGAPGPRARCCSSSAATRGGRRLVARRADRRDPEEPRRRLQLPRRGAGERGRRAAPARRARAARARLRRSERRGALVAGSLAAAVVLAPVVLALVGTDYLIARNTIVAVVPAAVCLGAGYATGRLGLAAAAALCVLSAAIALAPALDAIYGRTDWRGAAARLEPTDAPRAIVVTPYMSRTLWRPYLPGLQEPSSAEATVQEIAAIGLATEGGYSAGAIAPPRSTLRDPCRGSGSSRSSGRRRTRSSATAPTGRDACLCRR